MIPKVSPSTSPCFSTYLGSTELGFKRNFERNRKRLVCFSMNLVRTDFPGRRLKIWKHCTYQWRSQGRGALGNCPMLENLLPKDFWKWWLLPSVKNFGRNAVFRNSVEFSKVSYSLIGLNKAKCSLIDDKIFFCICSQLSHQDICIPQIIDYRYGIWIQLIEKIIALIKYNIKQWWLISLTRHIE